MGAGRVVVGVLHGENLVLEIEESARVDLQADVKVDGSAAGLLGVQVDLPQLAQRVRLYEVALVMNMETMVNRVALQVRHEAGDVDDCHARHTTVSSVPLFDYDSSDRDLIGFLHDVADAAADTLDEIDGWAMSGERDGQYEADVVVDDVVVAMLEASGFTVLSEESGLTREPGPVEGGELLVVVDPLDGSTNASRGLPWYATSLCIVDRDGPRAALVAEQSGTETRYAAVRGGGANCDGVPLRITGGADLAGAVVGVNGAPPSDLPWWQTRTMGAAALDISLVAKGALDGYVDLHDHGVWDYMAALLICREAGCVAVDGFGRDLVVLDPAARRSPVVAHSPVLLESLLSVHARSSRSQPSH